MSQHRVALLGVRQHRVQVQMHMQRTRARTPHAARSIRTQDHTHTQRSNQQRDTAPAIASARQPTAAAAPGRSRRSGPISSAGTATARPGPGVARPLPGPAETTRSHRSWRRAGSSPSPPPHTPLFQGAGGAALSRGGCPQVSGGVGLPGPATQSHHCRQPPCRGCRPSLPGRLARSASARLSAGEQEGGFYLSGSSGFLPFARFCLAERRGESAHVPNNVQAKWPRAAIAVRRWPGAALSCG